VRTKRLQLRIGLTNLTRPSWAAEEKTSSHADWSS
jgi:hypothetical protein